MFNSGLYTPQGSDTLSQLGLGGSSGSLAGLGITGVGGPVSGGSGQTTSQGVYSPGTGPTTTLYDPNISGGLGALNGLTGGALDWLMGGSTIPGTNLTTGSDTNAASVGLKSGSVLPNPLAIPGWLPSIKLVGMYAALFLIIIVGLVALVGPENIAHGAEAAAG